MSVNDNITLAKGSYSVTLETFSDAENIKNNLTIIPGVTAINNQTGTPTKSKIVDLLRLSHTWSFGCSITATDTKSAKTIKNELIILVEGARTDGGEITMTYEDETYSVYIEDCVIKKVNNDNTVVNSLDTQSVEYDVTLTIVEGEKV